jgi:hypothetical protein
MADSDEGVDDHEEHGFDGFGVGVDGSCELDDDFVGVLGNEDSEEVAEAHAGDEEGGVDGILDHFGLILKRFNCNVYIFGNIIRLILLTNINFLDMSNIRRFFQQQYFSKE